MDFELGFWTFNAIFCQSQLPIGGSKMTRILSTRDVADKLGESIFHHDSLSSTIIANVEICAKKIPIYLVLFANFCHWRMHEVVQGTLSNSK